MKVYLAGPLFSLAERSFNEEIAMKLAKECPSLEVILPQRHAAEICHEPDFCHNMFAFSIDAIETSDAVVAVLDGADADSGTCIEIGYARGRGKRVIGVRTDFRASEDRGLNLMVANACVDLLIESSETATVEGLVRRIVESLAVKSPLRLATHGPCTNGEPDHR